MTPVNIASKKKKSVHTVAKNSALLKRCVNNALRANKQHNHNLCAATKSETQDECKCYISGEKLQNIGKSHGWAGKHHFQVNDLWRIP